ncbi:MAG: TIGR03013 family XrtA/PEP-CTERM system glycosyltransferase [Acidobacteriota bacterium]
MIRFLNVYYPARTVMLLVCEALIVSACFFGAALLLLGPDTWLVLNFEFGAWKLAGVTVISLLFSYYFDLYEPQRVSGRQEIYFRILLVLGFDCFVIWLMLLVFPEMEIAGHGQVYLVGIALLTPVLIFWRRSYEWVVNLPQFRERVCVLGAGSLATSIVHTIEQRPDLGMEIVGWEPLEIAEPSERKKVWIKKLEEVGALHPPVERIITAMEDPRRELPVDELLNLRFKGKQIEDVGTLRERLSGKIQLEGLRPSTFLYSEGFRLKPSQQFARQIVSVSASAVGLLLFLPFFPLVVLLVKLSSPGPVFFKQTRVGAGGHTFQVVKFRTMYTNAEKEGAQWAVKNDPRVTRVGMFMRKTRVDEIPQLWNVLRGDMGFVGPRPERPEFVPMLSEALPFYYLRHLIRPGLTGWAQIRYGYGATMEEAREKLEYDLYYLKHMSLGLDLFIMFETIKTIVRRRGAQ